QLGACRLLSLKRSSVPAGGNFNGVGLFPVTAAVSLCSMNPSLLRNIGISSAPSWSRKNTHTLQRIIRQKRSLLLLLLLLAAAIDDMSRTESMVELHFLPTICTLMQGRRGRWAEEEEEEEEEAKLR
ncbi:hypothetical protein BHE74_00059528, partial [Ensete ventricosum]